MKIVMTLLVRDELDVVAATLEHHLAAGVSHVIATDNTSRDGTAELLQQYADRGVLTLIHEPATDYQQDRWVTRMARLAATDHQADWVINSDADEFLWPLGPDGEPLPGPQITFADTLAAVPAEFGSVTAKRHNLVAGPGAAGSWPYRLRLRDTQALSERGTPIGPKSVHRGDPEVDVAFGNHSSSGPLLGPPVDSRPFVILHAPDRSFEQFERKIANGGSAVESNTGLPAEISWHWRSDFDRLQRGELRAAWESRQLTPASAAAGMTAGTLLPERRLLGRLEHLRGQTVVPGVLDSVIEVPEIPAASAGAGTGSARPSALRRFIGRLR
ncbi:glycosyltransferase family 2 protein [Nakamurella silvestris]|nr:glycosyltransferase family 2 protein [Nakamurella silvestris]